MIGNNFPVRANALCLSAEKRASSAAMSPADRQCFDIFSPPPGIPLVNLAIAVGRVNRIPAAADVEVRSPIGTLYPTR